MPDKTAKLVRAYPPAVYGNAGTTISLLYKSDANYAVLSNIGSADAGLCGWRMFKLRYPSSSSPAVWMPFEWEHPPMKIGIEYRTTERYQQLPIYTKAVNFGAAPNATSKTVEHGITGFNQCVGVSGILGGANLIGHKNIVGILVNASQITIEADADLSKSNVYVILKYTKATS